MEAVEEGDVDETALKKGCQYFEWYKLDLSIFTHVGAGVTAVSTLANVAVVSKDSNVAEKLADDGDGRIAANHLAVVVAVDTAGAAGGRGVGAGFHLDRRRNGDGSEGNGGNGELHVDSKGTR